MVLSPFHLLKARITVEANVSVSFITVIIQPVFPIWLKQVMR